MALINNLIKGFKEKQSIHGATESTFYIVTDDNGDNYLQIDTYGSTNRKLPGKISQSIQFSPKAILELKEILAKEL